MTQLEWHEVRPVGPLIPFACTWRRSGRPVGITVWATSEAMVHEICDLPGLRVDGVMIAEADNV